MKKQEASDQKLKYGLIGALIGGVLVWLLMSSSNSFSGFGMMRSRQIPQPMMANSNLMDAHFIEQMIPHHEDAITMARLAPENATHPEIKTLSENIIKSQSQEIEQMKAWYKEWFGRELPTGSQVMMQHGMMGSNAGMHMGMMGSSQDLDLLKDSPDFDKTFIEMMIPHHQMAVMMASMLKNGTDRPEMKKLADDIITAQTAEIDQMRQWYQNWGY